MRIMPSVKTVFDTVKNASLGDNLKARRKKEEDEQNYSKGEFVQVMRKLDVPQSDATQMFQAMDKNKNGTVESKEFQTNINRVKEATQTQAQEKVSESVEVAASKIDTYA